MEEGAGIAKLNSSRETGHSTPKPRFSSRRAYAQTFTASAAARCLGVVSGVLAARLLGPTGRGELAVIISLPMLLVAIGELELPRALAYETSRVGEIPRPLIATSFWVGLFLGCIQALVLTLALPFYLPVDKLHLLGDSRWFILYLPVMLVMTTLMGSDQGKGRFGALQFPSCAAHRALCDRGPRSVGRPCCFAAHFRRRIANRDPDYLCRAHLHGLGRNLRRQAGVGDRVATAEAWRELLSSGCGGHRAGARGHVPAGAAGTEQCGGTLRRGAVHRPWTAWSGQSVSLRELFPLSRGTATRGTRWKH